jgi:phosphatidate cytidylyltransferase
MKTKLFRRVSLGLGLAVLVTAALWLPPPVIGLFAAAWAAFATLEFLALLRKAEILLNPWLLVPVNVLLSVAAYFRLLPAGLVAAIAIVWLFSVADRETRPRVPVYGAFVVFYLGFLPAHLVMLRGLAAAHGWLPWLVFFPLGLTWLADTVAWAAGSLFGRHQLAPTVSPKKTVEGYVAALALSAAASLAVLGRIAPFTRHPWWWLASVGLALAALGQAGDLFESVFKRAVNAKDSSRTLGEHGGFLDRVDSLLFTLPAFYYLCLLAAR